MISAGEKLNDICSSKLAAKPNAKADCDTEVGRYKAQVQTFCATVAPRNSALCEKKNGLGTGDFPVTPNSRLSSDAKQMHRRLKAVLAGTDPTDPLIGYAAETPPPACTSSLQELWTDPATSIPTCKRLCASGVEVRNPTTGNCDPDPRTSTRPTTPPVVTPPKAPSTPTEYPDRVFTIGVGFGVGGFAVDHHVNTSGTPDASSSGSSGGGILCGEVGACPGGGNGTPGEVDRSGNNGNLVAQADFKADWRKGYMLFGFQLGWHLRYGFMGNSSEPGLNYTAKPANILQTGGMIGPRLGVILHNRLSLHVAPNLAIGYSMLDENSGDAVDRNDGTRGPGLKSPVGVLGPNQFNTLFVHWQVDLSLRYLIGDHFAFEVYGRVLGPFGDRPRNELPTPSNPGAIRGEYVRTGLAGEGGVIGSYRF